jgi:hypothetical protein
MDYDAAINDVVTFLKQDKRISQPWRNYATKHFQEGLADVRMGLAESGVQPPPADAPVFPTPQPIGCICSPDMPPRRDCPVHGTTK